MLKTHLYDITKSFAENVTYGPPWEGELPRIPASATSTMLLGQRLNSAFGVAACPLTVNARSIALLSNLGYDLITYKSVRTQEWHGNPEPHWRYVDQARSLRLEDLGTTLVAQTDDPHNPEPTMVNSFGIHSVKPDYWQPDVDLAVQALTEGQALILSLMATPRPQQKLFDDARTLGRLAAETTVPITELNLACPNTDAGAGMIYEDVELSVVLAEAVKSSQGDRPLLLKIGYYTEIKQAKELLRRLKGVIAGITSTNTISMKITNHDGSETFPGRPTAGVSGAAIRHLALTQAEQLTKLRSDLEWPELVIVGVGGVTQPEHIDSYFNVGVDAVQVAVGAWANPLLAIEWKQQRSSP